MSSRAPRHHASIVACARWEAPYAAEWVAYHLALGFDHIYLACNDDDPVPFKAALDDLPADLRQAVSYRPYAGQGLQVAMYLDALRRARLSSDWICLLDLDEFIVLKRWASIPALTRSLSDEGVSSLHLNWLFYGHDGHATRPAGPVLDTYTRRARLPDHHTKHISRVSCFEAGRIGTAAVPFEHGLAGAAWSGFDRRTVLGDDVEPLLDGFPAGMSAYLADESRALAILETAYVAHFAFKSEDDFRLRVARGLNGNFGGQIKWQRAIELGLVPSILAELNEVKDVSLSKHSAASPSSFTDPLGVL